MSFLVSFPIFVIIAGGWLAKKAGIIKEDGIRSLNNFTYFISLPALIAVSLWGVDFLNYHNLKTIQLGLVTILAFSALILIILSFTKLSNSKKIAVFLIAASGNTVYMGFPMVQSHLGEAFVPACTLIGITYLIVPLLISIFVIRYWHDKEHNLLKELVEFIKNPLVISTIIGIGLSFIRIDNIIIDSIKKTLLMLGATASPIALFALGGFLHGKLVKDKMGFVMLSSILKVIIFPLFVAAISLLVFKSGDPKTAILLSSMPVAVTAFVISEKFRLDGALVGNAILVSTILSFLIIPIVAGLI